MAVDDKFPAVVSNLRKARRKWTQLKRVTGIEGGDSPTLGQIFFAVVKLVILYGSDTRFMTPRIGRVWGKFHHRVAYSLARRRLWIGRDGVWKYPLLENAMIEAGLQEVETYLSRRHTTVAQFIETRPIVDLCLAA